MNPREIEFSDLASYRAFLRAISSISSPGEPFITRFPEHAAEVVAFLFLRAEAKVEILTGHLDTKVFGRPDVIIEARAFLSRTRTAHNNQPSIHILYEDDFNFDSHPLIQEVCEIPGWQNSIMLRKIPSVISTSYLFHFMLSDEKHFRFKQDRAHPEALVQFNEPEFGKQLHRSFLKLWEEVGRYEENRIWKVREAS